MKKVLSWLMALLNWLLRFLMARKNIAVRLVFSLVYLLLLGVAGFALVVLVLLQFAVLALTTKQVGAIRSLSHQLTIYAYKVLRYLTLNEVKKPFPFGEMATELEPAEEVDLSVPLRDKPAADEEPAQDSGSEKTSEPEEKTEKTPEAAAGDPIILGHDDPEKNG